LNDLCGDCALPSTFTPSESDCIELFGVASASTNANVTDPAANPVRDENGFFADILESKGPHLLDRPILRFQTCFRSRNPAGRDCQEVSQQLMGVSTLESFLQHGEAALPQTVRNLDPLCRKGSKKRRDHKDAKPNHGRIVTASVPRKFLGRFSLETH
jgi:hypothetical protein